MTIKMRNPNFCHVIVGTNQDSAGKDILVFKVTSLAHIANYLFKTHNST